MLIQKWGEGRTFTTFLVVLSWILLLQLPACGSSSSSGGSAGDTTPPEVIAPLSPQDNATDVLVTTSVSATFSEPVNPDSVVFLLNGPGGVISTTAPSFNAGSDAVTITPDVSLDNDTTYVATISAAKDVAGNNIAAPFVWNFTTEPVNTAPTVSSHTPVAGAPAVATNSSISIIFSEAMSPATINDTNITVDNGVTASSVTYSGVTAVFTPSVDFSNSITYTVTVMGGIGGVADAAGAEMTGNYSFFFTTAAAPDLTAPVVSSTTPVDNATGVTLNSAINATFSEALNPATVSTATFTLIETISTTPVTGTVSYNGVTATFTPDSDLPGDTQFTATLAGGAGNIEDQAANVLAADYSWSFTTGPAPDTTPPVVDVKFPADTATGVATNTAITALFSESVDPGTINTSSFSVYDQTGMSPVTGSVTYNGLTASFIPGSNLANSSLHTVTLSGVTDTAGNPMALTTWTFTTAAAPDMTAPSVVPPTVPADMDTNVDVTTSISAEFDEPMDAATLSSATFTVNDDTNMLAVTGTVNYNGTTATFQPGVALAFLADITVTIDGATDLSGNPLPLTTWTFTTSAAPDTTGPEITNTMPADMDNNIVTRPTITIDFSEAIDCSTLLDTSLTLAGGAAVTFTSACSTDTATFVPDADLARDTTYTATLSSTVTDIAGNTLVSGTPPNPWMFTTVDELWTVQFGSSSHDQVRAVVTDSTGNVYIAGSTLGNMDDQVNSGGNDIFLSKYTSEGVRVWTRFIGTSKTDIASTAIIDSTDNIYIAGYSAGNLGGNNNNGDTKDIAVIKYDTNGVLLWSQLFGTGNDDFASAITIDAANNIYITGTTFGDFDGMSPIGMRNGSELFVLKLDSGGTEQWRTQLGSDNDIVARGITTDSNHVFVTGDSNDDLQEPVTRANAGSTDLFMAKYSVATGALELSLLYGNASDNLGYSIATDGTYLYFTGNTRGGLNTPPAIGGIDAFLMQTDLLGAEQWTRIIGTAVDDFGRGITVDSAGDIYISGYTLGSFAGSSNAGGNDLFVTRYDNTGATSWIPAVNQLGSAAEDTSRAVTTYTDMMMNVDVLVVGETAGALDGNVSFGLNDFFAVNYDGVSGAKK